MGAPAKAIDLLALSLRCRAEFVTDNGSFKGRKLVSWLVCYDAVARDKAIILGERLRAGKMFAAKVGNDVALQDNDDVYSMRENPHMHETIQPRGDALCAACGDGLSATPSAQVKEKAKEGSNGARRCTKCGEEVHERCAKLGSPICLSDSRPLAAAAKRASFMIPVEDKEAVISRFAHLRLPPHCAKLNPDKSLGVAKYIIGEVGADCRPLVVFINRKSGGQQGAALLAEFQMLLDPHQVFDLSEGGPTAGLLSFLNIPNHLVLACGGDGTAGWVLGVMDNLQYPNGARPPVAVLPLGTGNDLARVLGWGPGYNGEKLSTILYKISRADVTMLDRWQVKSVPSGESGKASPGTSPRVPPAPPSMVMGGSPRPTPMWAWSSPAPEVVAPALSGESSPQPSQSTLMSASALEESKDKERATGPLSTSSAHNAAISPAVMTASAAHSEMSSGISQSTRHNSSDNLSTSGKGAPPIPTSPKPRSRREGSGLSGSKKNSAIGRDERQERSGSASPALIVPNSPPTMSDSSVSSAPASPSPQMSPAPQRAAPQSPALLPLEPIASPMPPLSPHTQPVAAPMPLVSAIGENNVVILNNYMSIGFDADIALQFHEAREANPSHFKSRSINKLWYVKFSTPTMLGTEKLRKILSVHVDGHPVELKDCASLVVLNIPSYTAGADLWRKTGKNFVHPTMSDGKIELVALTSSWHLGRIQAGVEGAVQLAQGSHIVIRVAVPRICQIDGEAKRHMAAVDYIITRLNQVPMLRSPDFKHKHTHHHWKEEDLKKLIVQMGDQSHGVRVFDTEYNGKTHTRVFTGRSATDWLALHLRSDRDHARHVGSLLFRAGHIVYEQSHLSSKTHKHLKDDYLYYKFKDNALGRVPHHAHANPFLALIKVTVIEVEGVRTLPFSSGPRLRLTLDNQWSLLGKSTALGERRVYGEDLYFVVSRSDSVLSAELLPDNPIGEIGIVRISVGTLELHTKYDQVHHIRGKSSALGKLRLCITYRPMFTTRDDGHFFGLPEPHNLPKPQAGHNLACCSSLVTTLYGLYPDTGKLPAVSGTLPEYLRKEGEVQVLIQTARLLKPEGEMGRSSGAMERDSLLLPIIEVSQSGIPSSIPGYSPLSSTLENSVQLPPMSPRLPVAQPTPANTITLWTQLGSAPVDAHGRFELTLPEHQGSVPGFFRVRCIAGNTVIPGQLFLAPKGASLAIFSVENVLCQDVGALDAKNFEDERGTQQVREGSVALARAWAAKGVLPLYITTHLGTPRWLKNRGFPPGPVSLATFSDTLAHLRSHGWLIEAAYVREVEEVRLLREVAMLPSNRLYLVAPRDRKGVEMGGSDLGESLSPNVLRVLREAAPPSKPVPPLCISW